MKKFIHRPDSGTVVAIGKFDGVHIGHRKLIETAVSISQKNNLKSVVYIINALRSGLILSEEKRDSILESMEVDYIYKEKFTPSFKAMTPLEFVMNILIDKLNCKHVVVGYDFRFGCNRCADCVVLDELCQSMGIGITVIDEVKIVGADSKIRTVSSTLIRKFISNGDFKNANLYLGDEFTLSGKVKVGKQIGRTIGFPTANICPPDSGLKIASGVYATVCKTENGEYLSITNVGNNPTVDEKNPVTIETNIFDFSGNLYGQNIELKFLKRLRGEEKFPTLTALKRQIEFDKNYVINKYRK